MSLYKLKHFLQYNNATIIIFVLLMIIGGSVLAAPLGQEVLGGQLTHIEGSDNTLLLSTDLSAYQINYKVEAVDSDDDFYYVTYTYNDLQEKNQVWSELVVEKILKVSKKSLTGDLGEYVAGQLNEERLARLSELKIAQDQASLIGPRKRVKVTEYSGLIGQALDLRQAVFPDYEPVVKLELPSPSIELQSQGTTTATIDNLKAVYDNFVTAHPDLTDLVPVTSTTTSPEATTTATETVVIPPEVPAVLPVEAPVATTSEAVPVLDNISSASSTP